VELTGVVSEVLQTAHVLVKDKPVAVEVIQDGDVPLVLADPIRLRQIVMNLVSNAAKFTEQGTVTISFGRENEHFAYIAVADTGIGIAKADLGTIFEQFRQVDGSSTRRAGGTGLGLTITRYLVEMHNARISVESEVGAGSVFRVMLPAYETEIVRG
jgi:signal transduction histidine kinase